LGFVFIIIGLLSALSVVAWYITRDMVTISNLDKAISRLVMKNDNGGVININGRSHMKITDCYAYEPQST